MATQQSKPLFNTKHLIPSQRYHNDLMKQIDEAYWIGETDGVEALEIEAKHIKEQYVDKGEVWYPKF